MVQLRYSELYQIYFFFTSILLSCHYLSRFFSGKSRFGGETVMVIAQNTLRRKKKLLENDMTPIDKIDTKQALDPGALMLALYVLGVAALVLVGWFGTVGAGATDNGTVPAQTQQAVAVQ